MEKWMLLTRMPGDLPESGDERVKNMEQAVLKPQNLPERLDWLVDIPPTKGCPSIPDLMTELSMTDSLPGKIFQAI